VQNVHRILDLGGTPFIQLLELWVPENPAPLLPENLAPGITFID
jgi:hypothetical protein